MRWASNAIAEGWVIFTVCRSIWKPILKSNTLIMISCTTIKQIIYLGILSLKIELYQGSHPLQMLFRRKQWAKQNKWKLIKNKKNNVVETFSYNSEQSCSPKGIQAIYIEADLE